MFERPQWKLQGFLDLDQKSRNIPFTTLYRANKSLSPAQELREENYTLHLTMGNSKDLVSPFIGQQVIQVG